MPDYSNQPSNSSSKARNFLKSFTILGSFVVLTGLFVIVSILNQKNVAPSSSQAQGNCPANLIVRVSTPPGSTLTDTKDVSSCSAFDVLPASVVNGEPSLNSNYKVKVYLPDGTFRVVEGNLGGSNGSKIVFNRTTDVTRQEILTQNGTYVFRAVSADGATECAMARVNLTGCSGATTAPMVQDKDGWLVDSVGSCQNLADNSGNVVTNSQGMCSKKVVQNGSTIQRINQNVKCDNSACPAKAGDGATCTNIKPYYVTGANDGHGATLGDYYCQDRQTASSYDHPQNIGYKCDGTTRCSSPVVTPPPVTSSITVCAPESNKTGCTDGYVGTTAEDAAAKLQKAIADIQAGGTINIKNGTYKNTKCTQVDANNSAAYAVLKKMNIIGDGVGVVNIDTSSIDCKLGIFINSDSNLSKFSIEGSTITNILATQTALVNINNVLSKNTKNGFVSGDKSILKIENSIAQNDQIGVWVTDTSQISLTGNSITDNAIGIKINSIVAGSDVQNYQMLVAQNQIKNNAEIGLLCIDEGQSKLKTTLNESSTLNTFVNNKLNFSSQNGMCANISEASLTAGSTTYSVGGYVQDADTGRGYKDLTVTLKSPNKADKVTTTNLDGKYIFTNVLNLGDQYSVEVTPLQANLRVNALKNSTDAGNEIGWTYRTFENITTKRNTQTTDTKYEFQKAGENDCAGLRNGVANTNNRCNFVVTTTSTPIPACTSLTVNDQYGTGTSPVLINIGSSAVFKLNFTNITNQTGVINFYNYANGQAGGVIKDGVSTTVNDSTTYTYDQLKTFLGDTNLDNVIQVNGTLNPFVNYSPKCVVWIKLAKPAVVNSTMNLLIPNVTNTKDNRYVLNPGSSVSFELTKSTAFTTAPVLGIYNNDNEYNPGNPKNVKYNNADVVHTMSRANDTKYTRILKYEEVCVPDQNWNNQKVVNVQVNGFEGNTNDVNAVRWLKCTYPTNLVNGSCPATKVVGNCGTDVAMTCASGTPNVATQKVSGDYKCLGSNGGTDSVSCSYVCTNRTLPACTRTCEKDADCGTGKTCQEVQDSTCNPGLNGPKQACVATPAVNCIKTGCNGEICSDHSVDTTCQYKDVYACYKVAECKVQTNGQCGFTQTDTLKSCIASYSVTKCNKYDLNSDGKVDIFNDFTIFLNNFINNNLNSDFNNDKVVDIKDFLLFKSALYKYIDTKSCNL